MQRRLETVYSCILAVFGTIWILAALLPSSERIGHDYYHAIPRLMIGALYVWQNGWSLPHFTPSLCGGIPLLADPQSYFFSLPQALSFFIDPYQSSLITIALFYALGFWGMFRLARVGLGLSTESGLLAAWLFILNGFSFAHLYVGHLTHHPYLLFPWLILLPIEGLRSLEVKPFLGFALLWIYCIFGGAIHIAAVFAFGLLLFLPLIRTKTERGWKVFFLWFGGAFILVLVGSSAKIVSAYLYSRQFAVRPIDSSGESFLLSWFRYFWFIPSTTPRESEFGGMIMGAWEYIGFVSKLTLAALFAWLFRFKELNKKLIVSSIAMAVAIALVGYGRPLNSFLPVLSHYHNPIKVWASFIPLFLIITAFAFERLSMQRTARSRRAFLAIMILVSLFEFQSLSGFFTKTELGITFPYHSDAYLDLKKRHALPPVLTVVNDPTMDFAGIPAGFTSLLCYEPIFGYDRAGMHSTAVPGPAESVSDGRFNLNHPGCLLYPEQFNCKPWDRIPTVYKDQFEAFRRGQEVFEIPHWHRALYYFDLLLVLGVVALLAILKASRRRCYFSRPTI